MASPECARSDKQNAKLFAENIAEVSTANNHEHDYEINRHLSRRLEGILAQARNDNQEGDVIFCCTVFAHFLQIFCIFLHIFHIFHSFCNPRLVFAHPLPTFPSPRTWRRSVTSHTLPLHMFHVRDVGTWHQSYTTFLSNTPRPWQRSVTSHKPFTLIQRH